MVVLNVPDEQELIKWEGVLDYNNVPYSTFIEPDFGDSKTAIAISPAVDPKFFRKLSLVEI